MVTRTSSSRLLILLLVSAFRPWLSVIFASNVCMNGSYVTVSVMEIVTSQLCRFDSQQRIQHAESLLARARSNVPFQEMLGQHERDTLRELLLKIDRLLTDLSISYTMYGGTLLGSFRHHGPVPWDDDCDILVDGETRDKLRLALTDPQINEFGRYRLTYANGRDKFHFSHSPILNEWNFAWGWPYIDISYYYYNSSNNASHVMDHSASYDMQQYAYRRNDLFPLSRRPFLGLWLSAPRDSLAILRTTYGDEQLSVCVPLVYSHVLETFLAEKDGDQSRSCTQFQHVYPFVWRSWSTRCRNLNENNNSSDDGDDNNNEEADDDELGCVLEDLTVANHSIHVVAVHEPTYVIGADPFTLQL